MWLHRIDSVGSNVIALNFLSQNELWIINRPTGSPQPANNDARAEEDVVSTTDPIEIIPALEPV